jgi:hypothetical protein
VISSSASCSRVPVFVYCSTTASVTASARRTPARRPVTAAAIRASRSAVTAETIACSRLRSSC